MNKSVLFLLKKDTVYGTYSTGTAKSGLLNSAKMTADQIYKYLHYPTNIEVCVDGNEVWKFLKQHEPTVCVLEAIWVTPDKVKELVGLYPKITFIVLVHSEVPFLSNEGNAIGWIREFSKIKNVHVAFNSRETYQQFVSVGYKPLYLPNIYYDVFRVTVDECEPQGTLNVGCFGSIRPMKNQLIQAMAAAIYCNLHKLHLRFHINSSRVEQRGESVLKNIRAFFEGTSYELIEHPWMERPQFLELVKTMDIGLQLSLNETFNIVAADFISQGVPIIVSHTIGWMPRNAKAEFDNMADMIDKITWGLKRKVKSARENIEHLDSYNEQAIQEWKSFIHSI